jgi:type II secretory pathway pseudopilin PulG
MKTKEQEQGFIIGSLLVLLIVISVLLLTIISAAVGNYQIALRENARVNAQFAADSGLDQALHELNQDDTYPGSSGEVEIFNNGTIRTTYETVLTDGTTARKKIIRSTGRTYQPASETVAKATRIFELEAEAVTSGFGPGSVVSGVGGLILDNNAKITGGDVIVNGSVLVNNNAQIGLSTNPLNLRVAHQSCPSPADVTFPQVCTAGQPITNNGLIYADVQAQNQTNGAGMTNPGLTSAVFAPIAVPGYDRPAHKAAVTATYAANDNTVRCGNGQTKSWPANVKIEGNVAFGNNCMLTINGNVWITGNVTFGNGVDILIGEGVGATRPVVMIDGQNGFDTGNSSEILPNSFGTGAEVITTWWNANTSTNGGFDCGGIADVLDCTAVTGIALSTSQNVTTIDLSNNTNAANTVFRTLWTRAYISNNGALGAVAGQTVALGENAVINFTASIAGSDNLVTTWVKRGYLRVYQ